ncbi:hypothetical protein NYE54_08050 [Paenibacillus sp. FSL K6-1330]|uniref:hypothetical protein n=1 Tax=Paenibacillus sp. FSL K6-1330 TaxID=2975292 RepID=UPI0030D79B0F
MYKSEKAYDSINLSKDDILELESILEDKYVPGNTIKTFTVNTPNRVFTPISMYGFLNEKVPLIVDSISMGIRERAIDYSLVKYLSINISKVHVYVSIEGTDEVWVTGMAELLNTFFKKRKSTILQLSNLIPFFAGGLTVGSIFMFAKSVQQVQILSAILSFVLLLISIILANPSIMRKIFPGVKFSLHSKPKRDWQFIWTVTGSVGTILGLSVAIIALLK